MDKQKWFIDLIKYTYLLNASQKNINLQGRNYHSENAGNQKRNSNSD